MSRSFKKTPIEKFNCSFAKKMAKRKVRRTEEVFSGGYYKKVFDSYDICEFTYYRPWDYARNFFESEYLKVINNKYLSEKEKEENLKWIKENFNKKKWNKWFHNK